MFSSKTLIIIVTLILLGVAGFFGYRYIQSVNSGKENRMERASEENRVSENSQKNIDSDEVTNEVTNVQEVSTSDDEIDKELENLEQSLDLQLDEERK